MPMRPCVKFEEIKYVGCIYTTHGFEFDYVGVNIGYDLCGDKKTGKISADISATKDPMLRRSQNFEKHVKNIYKTLLTSGMKRCYVYFTDSASEKYIRERMEN
jgi:uncharacterized protein